MVRRHTRLGLRWPLSVGIFLTTLLVVIGYFIYHRNHPKVSPPPTATIHSLPVQSSGNPPTKAPAPPSNTNSGTATDNNGQSSTPNTHPSQWTQSQSGVITLEQPTSGTIIGNGTIISGKAAVSKVQFTLIDDSAGVVAEGTLKVVGGTFSGTLHFTPTAKTGRLDVFSIDPNGREVNEIQIPINF